MRLRDLETNTLMWCALPIEMRRFFEGLGTAFLQVVTPMGPEPFRKHDEFQVVQMKRRNIYKVQATMPEVYNGCLYSNRYNTWAAVDGELMLWEGGVPKALVSGVNKSKLSLSILEQGASHCGWLVSPTLEELYNWDKEFMYSETWVQSALGLMKTSGLEIYQPGTNAWTKCTNPTMDKIRKYRVRK